LEQGSIKVGRDRLFKLLGEENLLVKRKRRHIVTSDSDHSLTVYDNLLKAYEMSHAEEIFVSDVTYLRTEEGFCYLAIVADAYSKKIMGKFLSRDMQKTLVLKALVEALRNRQYNGRLIHHSDQGSVYCSKSYINALKITNTLISMSGKGRAWENPYAERIIGILKGELGLDQKFETYNDVYEAVEIAVLKYNTIRPHLSCGYLTPQQAHEKGKDLINCWKKKNSKKV